MCTSNPAATISPRWTRCSSDPLRSRRRAGATGWKRCGVVSEAGLAPSRPSTEATSCIWKQIGLSSVGNRSVSWRNCSACGDRGTARSCSTTLDAARSGRAGCGPGRRLTMSSSLQNVPDTPLPRAGRRAGGGMSRSATRSPRAWVIPCPAVPYVGGRRCSRVPSAGTCPSSSSSTSPYGVTAPATPSAANCPAALALQPDLVSAIIGANDVLLQPLVRSSAVRGRTRSAGHPVRPGRRHRRAVRPCLTSRRSCRCRRHCGERFAGRIESANDITRAAARRHGTLLFDAWAEGSHPQPSTLSVDRIHPNADGHRLIAASVAELLGVTVPPEGQQRLSRRRRSCGVTPMRRPGCSATVWNRRPAWRSAVGGPS